MGNREKVINHLQILRTWCAVNPDYNMGMPVDDCVKAVGWLDDALALLKAQEPMTEQEHKDLEILRKVRSGAILKSVSHDCVIYNGDWYRKNPWNQPRETRVLSLEEYRAIAERPLEERVPVWLEWRGGRGRWTIPERAYQGYGVNWRCWTGKPGEEEREAVKWDG